MKRTIELVIIYAFVIAAALNATWWTTYAQAGLEAGRAGPAPANAASDVTFNKDIAPLIFQNCAACHHTGGSAPFSLLDYKDVKKHARQIAAVTKSRYMPPWLPESGYGAFAGERKLSDEQIRLIAQWVEQGSVEGASSDLPAAPKFNESWQLGQPDMVLKIPQPFILSATGADVFRNFVIPVPIAGTRYVKAIEILPGNKKIVHHANILIDRTQSARRLDEQDPGVGFGGMDLSIVSDFFDPDSHFLFWKPGTTPYIEPADMAWRLDKGTDLVLNMHLQPSGKPETIQPLIGLYFTDQPPARFPMLLQLEHDNALDIPPGKKDFVITDEFELPLDVEVLGIYPHAHYLGRDMQALATLPDGTKKWLIRIKDWDLNWQAVFRYQEPFFLPKGSVISMRYTYDNSADNVRNPNHPPKRVVSGNQSTDEMGHLWVQVLPRERSGLIVLQEALMRARLRKYPSDFTAHFNLGSVLQTEGKLDEAIGHYRKALESRPDDAVALNSLGSALQSAGRPDEAIAYYDHALRLDPGYVNARYNMSNSLLLLGRSEEAIGQLRKVIEAQPDDADAHNSLGSAFAMRGELTLAAEQFERALRINPQHADARENLEQIRARIKKDR